MNAPARHDYFAASKWPPRRWQSEAVPVAVDLMRRRKKPLIHAIMGAGKSVGIASIATYIASRMRATDRVIVGTSSQKLVRQLSATIAEWMPGQVGQFYASRKQLGRRIIVACYDSIPLLAEKIAQAGLRVVCLLCDEAHKTEPEETRKALLALEPVCLMGLTATPYRSAEGESLSLFDPLPTANKPDEVGAAYSYGLVEALNDGVLVPPVWVTAERRGLDTDAWCIEKIRERALGMGPGIVSAFDIADATSYAERLRDEGIQAQPIHSRMKREKQEDLLEALRTGELQALVHVSLLTEGVDLPWLRWLCARRRVGARVRFAQEVGRVLRTIREPDAYGEKTHALILDPHALSESLSLTGRAELGEAMAGIEQKTPELKEKPIFDLPDILPQGREVPPTEVASAAGAWTSAMLANLQQAGLAKYSADAADVEWRRKPITPAQAKRLAHLRRARGSIPEPHRSLVAQLTEPRGLELLTRGAASDLITVLGVCADQSRESRAMGRRGTWKWPSRIPVPELVLPRTETPGRAA